jgi:peptide/nickel transport system substrate-binding protein
MDTNPNQTDNTNNDEPHSPPPDLKEVNLSKSSVTSSADDKPVENSNDEQADKKVALPSTPQPRKKSLTLKIAISLIIIVLIAGGVFAFLEHKHHDKEAKLAQAKIVQHLTVGIEGGDLGNTFYPNASPDADNVLMYSQVFDGLVQYENQNQIVPDLASGWTTPNSTTWLFTIKSGIKFHDGHTLTPADVVYSLNLMKNENQTNDYAETFATTLKSITAVGANKVKIVTTQPDPVLLNKLAFLYIVDQNLPKNENGSMAGTGAYQLKSGTKLTNTSVHLEAFNGFHGGQVMTKAVTIDDAINETSLVNGYKDHQYDIIGAVPNKDLNQPNSYRFNEQDDSVAFLGLNTTAGPLSNKLVREALRYAINPVQLSAQGSGIKATAIGQLIPPTIPGYNPNITAYKQNITKAKQLLTEAGYPNGLTLTFNDSTGNTIQTALSDQLKQVGITLKIDKAANFNDLISTYLSGQNQITSLEYASNTVDGADVLESTLVQANFNNPQFYNLVNQATTTLDPSSRLKLLQQAESIVDQNIPAIPLFYNDNIYLMHKPYVLHQDLPALYISVYFYKVHQ